MTDKSDWQGRVGESWASEWSRTDRSFSALTDRLLGLASDGGFSRALDIGCGAGEISLALARGHTGASIHGIDISETLIAVAKQRGGQRANVSFEFADAATWSAPSPDQGPDLIVSRHGVMFFDDPQAAFANMRESAAPGARLVFSCFRSVSENAWAAELSALVPGGSSSQPTGPGPFAFADAKRTRAMMERAGWEDVEFESFDYPYVAGTGDDPVEDAHSFFLSIGPAARAAAQLPAAERAQFSEDLRALLAQHRDGSMVLMKAGAWLVSAKAPA
ncbi:class I SAM-dependent methyltransferase [Qipengyuania sp. DSG2-2]|uniref:class I SAM-dependent methyltransferase n=1 Tax=Qipengyuania sp. DGS2-2 TaxID=3349631 RepID=UPI0036D2B87E